MPATTAAPKAVKAPLLDAAGKASKQVSLDGDVFAAEVKPHLVHETVRAELNAQRAGTRGAKSRGLVSGGRSKPWRQKGTGRARAGTTRAPHWTGGGVAFPPTMRSFEVKVNRKARRAALRGALAAHAGEGSLALVDGSAWRHRRRRPRSALLEAWGKPSCRSSSSSQTTRTSWRSRSAISSASSSSTPARARGRRRGLGAFAARLAGCDRRASQARAGNSSKSRATERRRRTRE